MAPTIHPPCTPSSSCTPVRCHPTLPPCQNPEKCLNMTRRKGIKPCLSAVSIMSTRSKGPCGGCGKSPKARNVSEVQKFLQRKSKEAKMRKKDRLQGGRTFEKYNRKKGKPRQKTQCCAGKGHRGRLKKGGCCEIL